jgi:putative DNA primase/helicase
VDNSSLNEKLKESDAYKKAFKEEMNGTGRGLTFNLTDLGNAERLYARNEGDILYCALWNKWLVFDGKRYAIDNTQRIDKLAQDTVRAMYAEASAESNEKERKAIAQHALKSEAEPRLRAMVSRAQVLCPVLPEQLDALPWLLNVQNGTIDLRTGTFEPPRREHLLTKVAPVVYDPKAECPIFRAFLKTILGESEALQDFLQRAVGRSLTGDVSEKILHVLWGTGDNGKTTFLEAIHSLLGEDYAVRTPTETLLTRSENTIPNDLAKLKGARFVYASEAEEGKRLAEARIKDLTGGDTIPARFMRGEWFNFRPEFKLWLGTNHKPVIRGTDKAIWNRVKLIPFTVTVPPDRQDKQLPDKLRAEFSGILTWAVEGCLLWQNHGLAVPDEVQAATQEYRGEMDVLGGFLKECCVEKEGARVKAGDLLTAFQEWSGEKKMTFHKFKTKLEERGFHSERSSITGHVEWQDLGLLAVSTAEAWSELNN